MKQNISAMIIINVRFLTQQLTGVQRFAFEICKRLPKKIGNKKVVFVVPDEEIINKFDDDKELVIIGRFKGQLWEQISLPAFLKKNNNPLLINFAGIAPVFYKHKIMVLHDLAFKHHKEWFNFYFRIAYNLFIPISIRNSKILVTVSEYVKEDIRKTYKLKKEKIKVIYNAPSKKFINIESKRKKIILTVSSIDPRKNLKRIIEAFNSVESDYKLIIVGKKHKTFSNLGLREETLNDNIIFTGYLPDRELFKMYNNAEIFIYASLFEGFGIPPLEAQACGCACIVSNTTSLPEIYQNSVKYCDPYSVESIKNGMINLINDAEFRNQLSNKGLENVKLFTWEKSTKEFIKIIKEIT